MDKFINFVNFRFIRIRYGQINISFMPRGDSCVAPAYHNDLWS